MSEMDVSAWNEFRVGDLFALVNSKPYHTKDISFCEDGLNYVTRTMFDNGIKGCVEGKPDFVINPAGTISFGAENADFFYQKEPYITGNKMYYMDTRCISEEAALFLKTVLQTSLTYRFSFSEGMVPARIKDELISLPATPAGAPDWNYMENYMKAVMEREEVFAEHLASLTAEAVADRHEIDVSAWGEFRVGDLFEVCTTKSLDKLLLDMNDSYEYPYVGRTGSDNGVQGYVQQQSFKPNDGHTFSVVQIGERVCQYRECEWYASQNMFLLKPLYDDIEMTALFMTTVITNALKTKFSGSAYSEYPTKISLTDLMISLPVTPAGTPDWVYMEQFMQQQMDKSQQLVEHLDQLI